MPFTFLTFLTFRRDDRLWKVRTLLGWTPGLRRLIAGRLLSCGCLAGMYDAWTGEVVAVIDSRGRDCFVTHHEDDRVLWRRARQSLELALDDQSTGVKVA